MPTTDAGFMTWREDDRAGIVGYAADGSVPLFTVAWTTAINEIGNGQTLIVKCRLPGFEHSVWRAGTFDDAKDMAEKILRGWHERVFAEPQ